MTWQVTLFNWAGFVLIMCIIFTGISLFVYYIFNKWLDNFRFCSRVGFLAFAMTNNGCKNIYDRVMIDRDGTKFKLVKIKDKNEK